MCRGALARFPFISFFSVFAIVTISRPLLVAARVCVDTPKPTAVVACHPSHAQDLDMRAKLSALIAVQSSKTFRLLRRMQHNWCRKWSFEILETSCLYATTAATVASATLRNARYSEDRQSEREVWAATGRTHHSLGPGPKRTAFADVPHGRFPFQTTTLFRSTQSFFHFPPSNGPRCDCLTLPHHSFIRSSHSS